MGKKEKKLKKNKAAKVPETSQVVNDSSGQVSEKDKKKINKKYGLARLHQAENSGWEGHELVSKHISALRQQSVGTRLV